MNREDIIRMALKVGLEQDGDNFFSPKSDPQVDVHITDLEAFATLVASAEREACAGLRKEVALLGKRSTEYEEGFWEGLGKYEDLIRARGQA